MNHKLLYVALLSLTLSACSSTPVTLTYNPKGIAARDGVAVLQVGTVTDKRAEPSTRLGAIRGGFGNPLKTLEASVPVTEIVRQALTDGLKARGLLAGGDAGRYALMLRIDKLDSSQLVRREAHTVLHVTIVERQSGRQVYERLVEDHRADGGSLVATGVFASVEDLHRMANESLQSAVDQMLNDPRLLAAIGVP